MSAIDKDQWRNDEGTIIRPGDTWVVTFPPVADLPTGTAYKMRDAIMEWAKKEGVRPPLVIFGGTVTIIPEEQP